MTADRKNTMREGTWYENAILAKILSKDSARLKNNASLALSIWVSCLLASSGEK